MKRAIVSVINDLSTDQRVHKHCTLLVEKGYDVLLIGRKTSASQALDTRNYSMHRMKLPFERGPLFYASYNLALLYHLLFRKTELLFSNDLDTLLPNYLVSRIKRVPLVYDSHEYFTEVPELLNRPVVQSIWKKLERWILPELKFTLTVNRSIAALYKADFGLEMKVVRNIPSAIKAEIQSSKEELGIPSDAKLVVLQGSGINVDRGAEEAVEAMRFLDGVVLLILGSGDVIPSLKERVKQLGLEAKVIFKPRMPYQQMMAHTKHADLGLTLDKDSNINYRFSLPNKLFDYIHAGVPILATDLVEVKSIVNEFEVGEIAKSMEPEILGAQVRSMLHSEQHSRWRANCVSASKELTWENEVVQLSEMIDQLHG